MPAAECRANYSEKLFVIPEATQLAMVATVYKGTVVQVACMLNAAK